MNQHDFDILLQKYLSGECSPEEENQIVKWSEIELSNKKTPINNSEQKLLEKKVWKRISKSVLPGRSVFERINWHWLAVAAMLTFFCGMAVFYPDYLKIFNGEMSAKNGVDDPGLALLKDYIEIKNTNNDSRIVPLEDGTIVTLTKESSLKYPKYFGKKVRQVELIGEAFFKVKKDSTRPFFVYTGELVTQVLGTSFNVKSYRNAKTIEVKVVSGRVSVYENKQKAPHNRNGVILKPNQKITFDKESRKLVPELVDVPVLQDGQETRFELIFEESSLSHVLSVIQKAYDVEIVVEKPSLNDCIFTGDLTGLPLHTQLRFICKSVNASYELRGTAFFIKGDGCNK